MNFAFLTDIFFLPACLCCTRRIRAGTLCESCRSGLVAQNLPPFPVADGEITYLLGAAGSYGNEALQLLIHALKFRFIKGAAEPLADILYSYASRLPLAGFEVAPIPLSKRREHSRGFNQSALIANIFAAKMKLPLMDPAALLRVRHKKPQSDTKNLAERQENIRGCFAAAPTLCAGKNILLIDDVTTSGATFLEAARALRTAGAKKIIALAVARA